MTHSAEQGSFVMEWLCMVHDEFCSMLLTLCASDSRPGTAAREKHYVVQVNVFQMLKYFEDWGSVSVKQEV
jgi:hypothetical protein